MTNHDFEAILKMEGTVLTSKRNRVLLVEYNAVKFVAKHYTARESLAMEHNTLKFLMSKNVPVPALLYSGQNSMILQYIPGATYESLTDDPKQEHIDALCNWFMQYYRETGGRIRGDVNLRNFLYHNGQCVSVDFEEPLCLGKPETDFGKFLAFLVNYDPAFTFLKQRAARMYLKAFLKLGFDAEGIKKAYLDEITSLFKRRGIARKQSGSCVLDFFSGANEF